MDQNNQEKERKWIAQYETPLGPVEIVVQNDALIGLWFARQHFRQAETIKKQAVWKENRLHQEVARWIQGYFQGKQEEPAFSMVFQGTRFCQDVWEMVMKIPYGTWKSYGQIAREVAQKQGKATMSAQAVGQALQKNPILLLCPCHRVLGQNGQLCGYSGGTARKEKLLRLEQEPKKAMEILQKDF